jgi:hypothetical protein
MATLLRFIPALAVAVLSLAGTAQARTAINPCPSAEFSRSAIAENAVRACGNRFEIPAAQTKHDPTDYDAIAGPEGEAEDRGIGCPAGTLVAGSKRTRFGRTPGLSVARWDYWTTDGQWVAWDGQGSTGPARGGLSSGWFYVRPTYHNWSPWTWSTQTFFMCVPPSWNQDDPLPVEPPAALRAQAAEPLKPAPDDTDAAIGTAHDDTEVGGGEDDTLLGFAGDDVERGGGGDDGEFGGAGADRLDGGRGDDVLQGGPGDDREVGGPGSDELFDDQGENRLDAGPGNDRISTRDGHRDVVDCGPGDDIAIVDRHDVVTGCEHAYRSAADDPARPPHVG